MSIKVGLKYKPTQGYKQYYIGRGSALGNPFAMKDESTRDAVCDKYADWLHNRDAHADTMLREIALDVIFGEDVELLCFCAPRRCHGDEVKRVVEDMVEEMIAL